MKTKIFITAVFAFVVAGFLGGCATLPDDGAKATVQRFDNLRAMRYCEVFLIGGDALTHDLKANFYNTTDLNNARNPRDTCPADVWEKVDAEALKKQYDVLGVFKNGPRYWAMDWIKLPVGLERNFDGLDVRWMGQVQLPKDIKLGKRGHRLQTDHGRPQVPNGLFKGPAYFHPGRPAGHAMGHAGLLSDCGPGPEL